MSPNRINRGWHLAHPMPPRATREQRIEWHLEHSQNCSCRPVPAGLAADVEARRSQDGRAADA